MSREVSFPAAGRHARGPAVASRIRAALRARQDTGTEDSITDAIRMLPAGDWPQHAGDWREDTITSFPAITGGTPPPETVTWPAAGLATVMPPPPEPCPCGMHPGTAPGKDALLSCAPGVTSRMWRIRVARGEWQDAGSLYDKAHAATHLPALDAQRRIAAGLIAGRHDIAAMLARNPGLHTDPGTAAGLRRQEAHLAGLLAKVQARGWHALPGPGEAA
jgi:hypothetical protein